MKSIQVRVELASLLQTFLTEADLFRRKRGRQSQRRRLPAPQALGINMMILQDNWKRGTRWKNLINRTTELADPLLAYRAVKRLTHAIMSADSDFRNQPEAPIFDGEPCYRRT